MKCPFNPQQKLSAAFKGDKGDGDYSKASSYERKSPLKNEANISFECLASPELTPPAVEQREDNFGSVHNKENQKDFFASRLLDSVEYGNDSILSTGALQEDSGYLSLYNSQIDQEEHGSGTADDEGKPVPPSEMPCDASPSELRLPLLQFEHTVCKELRKSYSRTQKFDWTVVGKIAEDFGLQNVVGRKMGLEHVDLLQELMERNMRHILTRILRFLGDVDLINCQKVSKTWRRVICEDKWAVQMCTAAEERLQAARPTEVHATRDFALSRVVLSCIQGLASTPVPKPSKRSSPKECKPSRSWRSRHKDFQEAANVLKQHEALRHCTHCGSPAKYDSYLERATCTRVSCSFDFCTRCLCEYHSNATCTTGHKGQGSQTGLLAGSSRSKKNLKRL